MRPKISLLSRIVCALVGVQFAAPFALGHGYAGERFFPPTVSTDDPFAVDELALPTVSYNKNARSDDGPANHEVDGGFELDKEIFPHFALGISDTYIYRDARGASVQGWDNLTLTAKYELFISERHEAVVSIGVEVGIGGTGYRSIGRDSFSTITPTVYFGKGFGDLPESVEMLRPFAVTGSLGQQLPGSSRGDQVFEWGFAVEYSLPYLQQFVRDVGLPRPIGRMIPLVEFAMETGTNHESRGLTTGTINPGVLYEDPHFQLGVEANIPINSESGSHVGVTLQLWIFIDDLLPKVFGHPVFGGEQ